MIDRYLLLDPEVYNMEQDLTKKLNHAIEVLSPLFKFQQEDKHLPDIEITNDLVNMSYNPFLNRIRACKYEHPFSNLEVGEEAGHYIHMKKNPLFGKYSNEEGLLLKQLIECVGRFSGLVYSSFVGDGFKATMNMQDGLKETHEEAYTLAEHLFDKFGESFLLELSKMKSKDFRKLKQNFGGRN